MKYDNGVIIVRITKKLQYLEIPKCIGNYVILKYSDVYVYYAKYGIDTWVHIK